MTTVRDRLVLELGSRVLPSAKDAHGMLLGMIGAAAAATAALVGTTMAMTAAGDAAAKSARGMDLSAEAFQRLEVAADLAGVSSSSLVSSVAQGNQRLADAAANGGRAAEAFDAIGIAASDAVDGGQSFADLLPSILDGLRGLPAAERALAGSEIFGRRRYAEFASLIEGGSEGLQASLEEATISGRVMSEETTIAAESLTDAMSMAGNRVRGIAVSLTSRLIPAFDRVIRVGLRMFDAISPTLFEAIDFAAQGLATALDALLTPLGRVVSAVALVGSAIKAARLLAAIPAVTTAVQGLTASLGPLLAAAIPIAAPILLAGLAIDDMLTYMDGGDSVIGRFAESMGADSELFGALENIRDSFSILGDLIGVGVRHAFDALRDAVRDLGPDFEWLGDWLDWFEGAFQNFTTNLARGAAFVREGLAATLDAAEGRDAFTAEERERYGSGREAIAARARARMAEQAEERAARREEIEASREARRGGDGGTVVVNPGPGMDEEQVGRAAARELRRRRSGPGAP